MSFKNIFYLSTLLFKGFSLLRAYQILKITNFSFSKDPCADLGSLPFKSNNISSFSKNLNITYFNLSIEKDIQAEKTIIIDFENFEFHQFKNFEKKFGYVFSFNVFEHLKNYKKVMEFSYRILSKNGTFVGSVPFMFRKHLSPRDYYRFTDDLLCEEFKSIGFKDINIEPLGSGVFSMFFNSIMVYNKKLSILNCLLFFIFYFLDNLLSILSKNNKKNFPIGYFFYATKN